MTALFSFGLLALCYNGKRMFLIPASWYEIKKAGRKGRGVFAKRDIPGGTVIGDYLGKIMRPEEEDESKTGLYTLWMNDKADILADPKKPGVHLLNHSCMPNCDMYPYKGHTLFFATRKIFKGEELTISYLIDPPDDEAMPCPHSCHCGTPLCQGTMHTSYEASDKWTAFMERKQGKDFNKMPGPYGSQLQPFARYPKAVPDAPIFRLFGSLRARPLSVNAPRMPARSALRSLIRKNGRRLSFKKLGLEVLGATDEVVFAAPRR